jgi:quercetin dioxygenase-like cupin family protein
MRLTALLFIACLGSFAAQGSTASAQEVSYQNLVTPVLATSETVLGEKLAYPSGAPAKVTAVIVTVAPGGQTGWHRHPVPLFAYILDGTLAVDYGSHGKRTCNAGDAIMEAMRAPHNGTNSGATPVRILAVYMGAEGLRNAEAVEATSK